MLDVARPIGRGVGLDWCLLSAACSVGLFGLAITLWVSQSDAGVGDET
jgi:hypothetical protein